MNAPSAGLSERDISYLKLLKTLKQAPVTEGALGVVRRIAEWIDSIAVLNFICTHQPWIDDWEVKEGLVHNDLTPARWRAEIEKAIAIFDLLREMDDPALSAQDKAEIQDDIKYLFKTLAEHDRAIVKEHAYTLSASRRGKTHEPHATPAAGAPAATAAAPAPPAPTAAPPVARDPHETDEQAGEHDEYIAGAVTMAIRDAEMEALNAADSGAIQLPAADLEPDEAEEAPPPGGAAIASLPVDQRAALAASTNDVAALKMLAFDMTDAVLLGLLENPNLDDRVAATVARRASARVAEAVYRHRRIFMRPLVREALLECPNAPSAALLEVVGSISDFNQLLKLIKNPKIKFLEVKAKARGRLSMMFKSLGMSEKVSAIRRAGSSLLKELWTDFFRDEALVAQCVAEKSLDPSIILEIARSKIAPRRALELIAANPQYVSNYQICLELVMNPKTPRQVVTKLLPKLNANDRKMIKNNPAIPEAIRRFA